MPLTNKEKQQAHREKMKALKLVRSHGGYCYPETKKKIAEMVKVDRDRAENG